MQDHLSKDLPNQVSIKVLGAVLLKTLQWLFHLIKIIETRYKVQKFHLLAAKKKKRHAFHVLSSIKLDHFIYLHRVRTNCLSKLACVMFIFHPWSTSR